jgi:glycosyltransferase involved in cell wall biosynthesis
VTNLPAVSVVMAAWNPDRAYVTAAIRSILEQTFRDLELVIVEDPSERPLDLSEFADDRIRLIRREQRGSLGSALNEGIAAASAELIARIDADDVALPQRIARQYEFMQQHPEIAVYGSRIRVIDDSGATLGRRMLPLEHEEIANALRRYNCISHPSVMFRKAPVVAVGGYDRERIAEDYDLWCRLLLAGARFANSDEELVLYRFHEQAAKYRGVHDAIRVTIEIKKQYFAGRFTLGDRLRLAAETALLRLPPALIIRLFRWLEYRQA